MSVFELGWLFWILIVFLFAERWFRVLAAHYREDKQGAIAGCESPCGPSAPAG